MTRRNFWLFDKNYQTEIILGAKEAPKLLFDTHKLNSNEFYAPRLAILKFLILSILLTRWE